AEDGIRDFHVTGVQTCALPILFNGHCDVISYFRTPCTVFTIIHPGRPKTYNTPQIIQCIRDPVCLQRFISSILLSYYGVIILLRSEERRVGKECSYLWSP